MILKQQKRGRQIATTFMTNDHDACELKNLNLSELA